MSTELLFVIFFILGFVVLQSKTFSRFRKGAKNKKNALDVQVDHWKTIAIETQAGHFNGAVAAWRSTSKIAPTPAETFRFVAESFLAVEKDHFLKEATKHIKTFRYECCNVRVAAAILEVTARAGEVDLMEKFMRLFCNELHLAADLRMYDVVIGGFAAVGREEKVHEVFKTMRSAGHKLSARGYSLSIKGFLKNNMAEAALRQVLSMTEAGYRVPPFAVGQIFRATVDLGGKEACLNALESKVPLPAEAVSYLFDEFCAKQGRYDLVDRIEAWARRSDVPTSCGAFDWLLKHWASIGDARAIPVFEEIQRSGGRMSEALCVGLLARCAESKFLRFAEIIWNHIKTKQTMTIATYSALMKVYAMSGMYDQACDLYYEITSNGLEPDATMYGCLMKFSVDCGRTDLAHKLFQKAPRLEIQNYMSLIRAAGRDRDVDRAFATLKKLEDSNISLDLAAYNCVLDVCISVGRIDRARELLDSVRKIRKLDVVTWNTLLKGYCHKSDLEGAKGVLSEMEADGHPPNDISFNCLINAAVCAGNFTEAWNFVTMMEERGIPADHYTMSILMKSMRKVKATRDVGRALALLDKTGLNVFTDEVLLCTVVEVCMRHREGKRLQAILDAVPKATMKPSTHTYGTLIKACSSLHDVQRASDLWHEMVSVRGLKPNEITLGCMLDALVCNGRVDDAVALMEEWKNCIPPNAVMYSTIIKGFANARQSENAMAMWQKMRVSGGKMNTATYNTVIDAQARTGAMDAVSKLLKAMCKDGCKPDANTNSAIVKGYCVKGDIDRALEVFQHMQEQHMVKDAIMYNTLLDGCARHSRRDVADNLLEDMEKRGISPTTATLGAMLKLYARLAEPETAMQAIKSWPEQYKVTANGQTWATLISALLNEGNLEAACNVFDQMKVANVTPDAKAYGSLMAGCVRKGNLLKALAILDEAHGMGAAKARALPMNQWVDVEHLEALVRAVANRKGAAAASVLVNRLVAANTPLNSKILAFSNEEGK